MKNPLKTFLGFLMIILVTASCKETTLTEEQPLQEKEFLNVAYGENMLQTFDLYLPANHTLETKVVVLIHGGFWFQGDKSDYTQYAKFFQSQGFAVANINYRLTNTPENNIHPAQVNDIKKALNFISGKAAEWNISSDKFALVGASSGGHLGLLYTYVYNQDNKVKTVVSIAGPTNLTDSRNVLDNQKIVTAWFLGTTIEQSPQIYKKASPITYACEKSKPTLLIHGKDDVIVPVQQAIDLKTKLDQFKIPNNLLLVDNAGHEDVINDANKATVLGSIVMWLNTY
ncbi:prolyl oligopeptidase family serine peptidase [Rubrolithibacter danxiaensis]|uniref:prolyl oligopeptidase family serine peptidase n=1 Tax=Rubrolithibacter danxiaensis TaxID=3390805 RepID=UPI003BF8DC52